MKITFFVSYKKNVTRNKLSILPGTIVKANVAKSSSSKRKIMNLVVLESPVPYLYKDGMYYTVEDDGEENDPGEET